MYHLKGIQIQNILLWNDNRNDLKSQKGIWIQLKWGLGLPWCFKNFIISNQQVTLSLSVCDYLSILPREIWSFNQRFLLKVMNTFTIFDLIFNVFPFLILTFCSSWRGRQLPPSCPLGRNSYDFHLGWRRSMLFSDLLEAK